MNKLLNMGNCFLGIERKETTLKPWEAAAAAEAIVVVVSFTSNLKI